MIADLILGYYKNKITDRHNYFFILCLIVACCLFVSNTRGMTNAGSNQKVVAYYYCGYDNNIPPSKINYKNLTHIIESFAWPNANGSIGLTQGLPNSTLINDAHNANVKVLVSFGGSGNSSEFAAMASDSASRATFVKNVVNLLAKYEFDGVDLDWEYPTFRQGGLLTQLVKDLRNAFDTTSASKRLNEKWLIAMAVPATSYNSAGFQYANLINYVDWFSVMTYDFYGSWSSVAGNNAPMFESVLDPDQAGSCYSSIEYILSTGIPPEKMLLGVPFYGKQFNASGLYKPYTGNVPDLNYSQIVDSINTGEWNYYWDDQSMVPYLINKSSTKFITYDDTASIKIKTDTVKSMGLGGIMIWALGLDADAAYNEPLLNVIGNTLFGNPTAVAVSKKSSVVHSFYLSNNYPNPFNPSTEIRFSIPASGFVSLKVYNIIGQVVASLVNNQMSAGIHQVTFNGEKLSSGVYLYILSYKGMRQIKKMILLK